MPATYLTKPDQSLTVLIQGESGTGKTGLAQLIKDMVVSHGAIIEHHSDGAGNKADRIVIRSKTTAELRNEYVKGLTSADRATLKVHLSYLGVEL